jgi:hypothetical protein
MSPTISAPCGLKFVAGIEFEIGDGEIWRLAASGISHSFVEFATHQPFRLQPRDAELVMIVEITIVVERLRRLLLEKEP